MKLYVEHVFIGNDFEQGDEVNAYIPSFTFDFDAEKGIIFKMDEGV